MEKAGEALQRIFGVADEYDISRWRTCGDMVWLIASRLRGRKIDPSGSIRRNDSTMMGRVKTNS